jgi:hypothetical protein
MARRRPLGVLARRGPPGDAEVGREGDDGLVDPPQHPGGGEQVRPVRVRIAGDLGRCGVDDALAGTDVVP